MSSFPSPRRNLWALAAGAAFSLWASPAAADLLSLYRLDNNFNDVSGAAKLGAFNGQQFNGTAGGNAAISSVAGNPFSTTGNALTLDGSGDFVDVLLPGNSVNPFNGTQNYTITGWFRTTAASGNRVIVSSARGVSSNSMAFFLNGNTNLRTDNYQVNQHNIPTPVTANEWHFGAVTYSAATNTFRVQLDGNLSVPKNFNPNIPNIGLDTVRIGGTLNTTFPSPDDWQGQLSHVAIFNHALTNTELTNIRNNDFTAYGLAVGPIDVGGSNNIGVQQVFGTRTSPDFTGVQDVRAVRVSKTGGFLSLREIQIFDDNNINVGLASNGGIPSASSLWGGGTHPLSALNDGITTDNTNNGATHTGNPSLPTEYFQITLDNAYNIESVRLFNRGSCCPEQGQNLTLQFFSDTAATNLLFSQSGISAGSAMMQDVGISTIVEAVGGTRLANLIDGGAYLFEINGDTLAADLLTVPLDGADDTELNANNSFLMVQLAAGTLEPGDTFQLLAADAYSGSFAGFDLPGDLSLWDTSNLLVDGTITFVGLAAVPEPSTLFIWAAGGLLAICSWRCRRNQA